MHRYNKTSLSAFLSFSFGCNAFRGVWFIAELTAHAVDFPYCLRTNYRPYGFIGVRSVANE